MGNWSEVTEPAEIARLNQQFKRRLKDGTREGGLFRIGTPAGHFEAKVRFAAATVREELWVYSGQNKKTGDFITLVGRHVPGSRDPLLIDLQFNFPNGRFSRQKGGAFIKDRNGRAFLAHRGIVTRGTSRVQKSEVLRHLNWHKTVTADSVVKPHEVELQVVAALDDDRLVAKILRFAGAMRDAATLAADQETPARRSAGKPNTKQKSGAHAKTRLDLALSEYRDEFAGTRVVKRKGEIVMDWTHGRVVRALRKALDGCGESLKCQAADLIVRRRRTIDLFEVKPSSGSQSIYTAIGQLVFNGRLLEGEFQSYSVRKFLVLPSSAKHQARQERCKELGFRLVTFEPNGDGFKFVGLPK